MERVTFSSTRRTPSTWSPASRARVPDLTEMHSPQGTVCSVPSTKAASANFVQNGTHLLSEESTKDRRAAQSMRRHERGEVGRGLHETTFTLPIVTCCRLHALQVCGECRFCNREVSLIDYLTWAQTWAQRKAHGCLGKSGHAHGPRQGTAPRQSSTYQSESPP